MKKTLFLLFAIITLASCTKENKNDPDPDPNPPIGSINGTTWYADITDGSARLEYTFKFGESTMELRNKKTDKGVVIYDNKETLPYTKTENKVSIKSEATTMVCTITGNKMTFQVPSGVTITLTKQDNNNPKPDPDPDPDPSTGSVNGTTWYADITDGSARLEYTFKFGESTMELRNKKTSNGVVIYDNNETLSYTQKDNKVTIKFEAFTVICTITGNKMTFPIPSKAVITLTKQ